MISCQQTAGTFSLALLILHQGAEFSQFGALRATAKKFQLQLLYWLFPRTAEFFFKISEVGL